MRRIVPQCSSINRDISRWEEHLTELTPVEEIRGLSFKREDYFAPLGYGGINGSKVRQCIWLISEYCKNAARPVGVLSASSVNSPQISAATVVGRHFGLDVTHVVGPINPKTACKVHTDVAIGAALGAQFLTAKVSYNPYLQKTVNQLVKTTNYRDHFLLPYGISLPSNATDREIEQFHAVGANQVSKAFDGIRSLVMSAGSCNSCTSVLYGIAKVKPKTLRRIVLFGIGPPKLDFLQSRLEAIGRATGEDIGGIFRRSYPEHRPLENIHNKKVSSKAPYELEFHDLHSTGEVDYQKIQPYSYGGIEFHPRYEGKVMKVLLTRPQWKELIRPDTLFWIVGAEPRLENMPELFGGGWGPARFDKLP